MSTTTQTYWQSSAEIWEGQRNYSLKNEVRKDAISCFSIRKDWRFAVRAKSFAQHWRSRGFFRGHVRSCEKGLCDNRKPNENKSYRNCDRNRPISSVDHCHPDKRNERSDLLNLHISRAVCLFWNLNHGDRTCPEDDSMPKGPVQ